MSRKIVSSIVNKEQARGYQMDKDTDHKIKKYVENYFSQYQELVTTCNKEKNRTKLEDWLQQSSSPSSIL